MVQFHQSYSHEDFIRGYRPLPEKAGTFGLKDGVFLAFASGRAKILKKNLSSSSTKSTEAI
jgi:hypothetical protein